MIVFRVPFQSLQAIEEIKKCITEKKGDLSVVAPVRSALFSCVFHSYAASLRH
jgi:hypothetical protein